LHLIKFYGFTINTKYDAVKVIVSFGLGEIPFPHLFQCFLILKKKKSGKAAFDK